MRCGSPCSSAFIVALLALPSATHAQRTLPWLGPDDRAAIGGDLAYFSDEQVRSSLTSSTLRVDGSWAFDAHLSLEGRMGLLALGSSPEEGEGNFVVRPGNPTALFAYRGGLPHLRYQVGVGGAAPLAVVDPESDGRLQRAAYNHAVALNGMFDLTLWAHSHGAVIASGMLDMHVLDRSWLTLELEPSVVIPARTLFLEQNVLLVFPGAITFGARGRPFDFGVRVQGVATAFGDSDPFALSLGPFVRVDIARSFVRASYLANVFEPFAGARGPGIWAVHVAGGGVL